MSRFAINPSPGPRRFDTQPTVAVPNLPPRTLGMDTDLAALLANAQRLGLTWQLRPGTVQTDAGEAANAQAVPVIVDGDTASITAVSMVGLIGAGVRVMVIEVPPAGNFIVGVVGGNVARNLVQESIASLGSDQVITTATTSYLTLTIANVTGAFMWEADAVFDFSMSATPAVEAVGSLQATNGIQGQVARFGMTAAGQRACVAQIWSGTDSGALTDFQLLAEKNANVGTVSLRATNTRLRVRIYQ